MKNSFPRAEASNPQAGRRLPLGHLALRYLALFLLVLGLASFLGSTPLSVGGVIDSYRAEGDAWEARVWFSFRFQRLMYAAAVGAVLALTGTVFQAVLRNPLAEPYILGISGASALGAVVARWLCVVPWLSAAWLPEGIVFLGPLVGSVAGVCVLLAIARWAGLYDPPSLILAGAVLNAIFGALILLFYTIAPERQVVSSLLWLMGNIGAESLAGGALRDAILAVAVGGVLFAAFARHLDLLSLGEEEAADLGVSPRRLRIGMLVVASLLAGFVVAAAGPIGFIGLVVPHIMRRLHGPGHRRLIPLSMLGGAIFVMVCDTAARTLLLPHIVPIGVVTALAGGPFFLFLLGSRRRRELSGAF